MQENIKLKNELESVKLELMKVKDNFELYIHREMSQALAKSKKQ